MFYELYNGVKIPSVFMGTYPLKNEAMDSAVDAALEAGYRGFDTARNYLNEDSLGNSLHKFLPKYGLTRQDVFITTKIGEPLIDGYPDGRTLTVAYPGEHKDIPALVDRWLAESLSKLHTDYIDLLLIHWPYPDYFVDLWRAFEEVYFVGKVRAIGVSNCREWHLKKLLDSNIKVVPMVNQIEHHPFNSQRGIIEVCRQLNIRVEAYSPLIVGGHGKTELPPGLLKIAQKYQKSIAQVVLRWNVQQGIIPLPKSGSPDRLRENIAVFDFELSPEEMTVIDLLNEDNIYLKCELFCPGFERFKVNR